MPQARRWASASTGPRAPETVEWRNLSIVHARDLSRASTPFLATSARRRCGAAVEPSTGLHHAIRRVRYLTQELPFGETCFNQALYSRGGFHGDAKSCQYRQLVWPSLAPDPDYVADRVLYRDP